MHVDQSVKDAQDGVRYTAVFAGDRKNDLNPHDRSPAEAHAVLKPRSVRIYNLFVETVARHRGIEDPLSATPKPVCSSGEAAVASRTWPTPSAANSTRRWRKLTHPFP